MNIPTRFQTRTALGLACLLATGALAQTPPRVDLRGAHVGGPDVQALAKFYQDAFGLQEYNHTGTVGTPSLRVFLTLGASVEAAKAGTAPHLVVIYRAENVADPVSHLILNVKPQDMATVAEAVVKAGGKINKPAAGQQGVGEATDPAGNLIELFPQK